MHTCVCLKLSELLHLVLKQGLKSCSYSLGFSENETHSSNENTLN